MTAILLFGVLAVVLVWGAAIYNRLMELRNRTSNALAQIDVQLKRRYDLIPNLVSVAKKYLEHESQTLESVIRARGQAQAAATALREAHEEVGLDSRFVEVVGSLPVYITGTAFTVTPVVALVQPDFVLQPNRYEVADVFEVPLSFLMNPANHRRHAIEWEGVRREWFSMPFTDPQTGKEHFIWGATAGMLRNFYRFLSA